MVVDAEYLKAGAILLPGVSLFPNNAMPLHIFEERYREMLSDALASNGKFIIGTLPEVGGKLSEAPLKTAVVVKVVANEELPDGRSVLVVSGRERIQVVSWEKEPSYPRAVYRKLERDETEGADTIISLLKDGFESVLSGISGEDRKLVLEHLDSMQSLEAVIDVVAQYTVVDEKMRRYFLEEDSDSERASKLLLYLEGK